MKTNKKCPECKSPLYKDTLLRPDEKLKQECLYCPKCGIYKDSLIAIGGRRGK